MESRIHIVGGKEVRAQDPLEPFAEQVRHDLTASGVMVLVIAYRRRINTPDVAILAVFAPACLIGLHGWASFRSRQLGGPCKVTK